jgi:sodium/potassium-transporting ATPase subunit alpha
MILLDDNFATIVVGVEEGRRIFDNMKKITAYLMSGSVATLYPFVFYVVFGFPLALGTITVLFICLGTDMMPAISLTHEKAESDIMKLKPRNPFTDKLVTRSLLLRAYFQIGMIDTLAGYLGYFVCLMHYGWKPQQLWQFRAQWDSDNDVVDSFGTVWVIID